MAKCGCRDEDTDNADEARVVAQGDKIDEEIVSETVNETRSLCVASEKQDASTLSEIIAALDEKQR